MTYTELERDPNEPPGATPAWSTSARSRPTGRSQSDFGDRALIDAFRDRVQARLQLVPPHDPQFRRNRERVIRDAERENLLLDWDLGQPEDD